MALWLEIKGYVYLFILTFLYDELKSYCKKLYRKDRKSKPIN